MTKEPKTSAKDNPLVRALSRWENEGGRTDTDGKSVLPWSRKKNIFCNAWGRQSSRAGMIYPQKFSGNFSRVPFQ